MMTNLRPFTHRSVILLAAALFLVTAATLWAAPQEPAKPRSIGSVAIDTVPLPERPASGFRFESFFLDHLVAAGALDSQADLNARFRLTTDAIRLAGSVGYFFDRVPEVCLSEFPPKWCWYAGVVVTSGRPCLACGGVTTEGKILLIESLVGNGVLVSGSRLAWRKLSRTAAFVEFAATLFRHIKANGWSAQKALGLLDQSFATISGAAYPIPDSEWDRYCREHPEDPICWVIRGGFISAQARNMARELALVSLLQQEKLLSMQQTRAIYDVTYRGLTPRRGLMDLSSVAGGVIIDGLRLNPKLRIEIMSSLGTNRVGLVDPDSPWADICFRDNPPPICKFINTFPVAPTLTTQLIKNRIWSKNDAIEAWNKFYLSVGGGRRSYPQAK
jgi:hypothetical protein